MSPTEAYEYIKTHGGKAGQIADPGSETQTYGVTNGSSDHYVFSGDATGNDPTISVSEGTVLTFNINVGSGNHPFWIKPHRLQGRPESPLEISVEMESMVVQRIQQAPLHGILEV